MKLSTGSFLRSCADFCTCNAIDASNGSALSQEREDSTRALNYVVQPPTIKPNLSNRDCRSTCVVWPKGSNILSFTAILNPSLVVSKAL